MSKFKIGDKVRLKANHLIDGNIVHINKDLDKPYSVWLGTFSLWYKEDALELVEPAHKVDCTITKNFLKEYRRMCLNEACPGCPMDKISSRADSTCEEILQLHADEAMVAVQKWSDEHPEEPVKTIKDDFLEKHPNARLHNDLPVVCIKSLGYIGQDYICPSGTYAECKKCWNRPLEEVQK